MSKEQMVIKLYFNQYILNVMRIQINEGLRTNSAIFAWLMKAKNFICRKEHAFVTAHFIFAHNCLNLKFVENYCKIILVITVASFPHFWHQRSINIEQVGLQNSLLDNLFYSIWILNFIFTMILFWYICFHNASFIYNFKPATKGKSDAWGAGYRNRVRRKQVH